jgi:CBS domain-containing protein
VRYEYAFLRVTAAERTEASIAMIRIPYDTTLGEAARLMQDAQVTVALVVDRDDLPIGVLTERHLLSSVAASRHPDHGTAGSWMARVVIDADGHATLPETDAASQVGIGAQLRR